MSGAICFVRIRIFVDIWRPSKIMPVAHMEMGLLEPMDILGSLPWHTLASLCIDVRPPHRQPE